jgi:hypothetical protein
MNENERRQAIEWEMLKDFFESAWTPEVNEKLKSRIMEIKEQIAKTCHEVNRAWCGSIGDFSQPSWENAEDWQQKSAINGVELHLNRDVSPEQSHENWMQVKLDDGWTYGEVKDVENKKHPCLVPYLELPYNQQVKDHLFRAVVNSFK